MSGCKPRTPCFPLLVCCASREALLPLTMPACSLYDAVMDKTTSEGKAAADVARLVLDAVGEKRKEVLVVPGFLPALAVYLRPLCPALFFTLMARRAGKDKKEKES